MQKSWMGDIPNTHVRDYQRKRLYDAEDSAQDLIIEDSEVDFEKPKSVGWSV